MLARIATGLSRFSSRWVPDAWIIAVLLTVFTAGLAIAVTDSGPVDVVRHWGDGFWKLLEFAMQMSLIIMTGYVVSTAPLIQRMLERAAGLAKSPRGAVALMAVVSLVLGWLNWGLSIAASAVFVRHVARRQPGVDYRLLVCAAYFGVATIWHAGLSGSAPLSVATAGHPFVETMGVIPISESVFHPFNLGLSLVVLVVMPLLVFALHPPPEDAVRVDPRSIEVDAAPSAPAAGRSPARWIEESPIINWTIAAAAFAWLGLEFHAKGVDALNLNVVNFTFLAIAVLLHRNPSSFLGAASDSGRFIWGIAIQFPFYAGILGILSQSGLSVWISERFQSLATPGTYPAFVLVYSGFLNYIVPSGGSQWAVSGEYIMQAANDLGVGYDKALIAFAWGDMSTNLIQPFWAIPLLGIAGLRFRDIMGYSVLLFLLYMALLIVAFLGLGFL